jgi:hypothetical protein
MTAPPAAMAGGALRYGHPFCRGFRLRRGVAMIVSGGQTGVDRAALDVARLLGVANGGWCPKGRRAEDGPIDARYPLRESASRSYAVRTRLNVRDSDGTLVLTRGPARNGTALTIRLARRLRRPLLVVNLVSARHVEVRGVRRWLRRARVAVLNVAGPRESKSPGVYALAAAFLERVLTR